MNWSGVMPAMTTAFDAKDRVDYQIRAECDQREIENEQRQQEVQDLNHVVISGSRDQHAQY